MVRLTDRPDMILDVYRGRKTATQQQQQPVDGVINIEAKIVDPKHNGCMAHVSPCKPTF